MTVLLRIAMVEFPEMLLLNTLIALFVELLARVVRLLLPLTVTFKPLTSTEASESTPQP